MLVDFKNEQVVDLVSVEYFGGDSGTQKNEYDYKGQSQNLDGSYDFSLFVFVVLVGDKQEEEAKHEHN